MDEELYLECLSCGEKFDTIRTAWDHDCDVESMQMMLQFAISMEL